MTYGTSLGVAMPVVGAAGPGTALAAQINACVDAIIARLETKVTVAGMDINADLSLRSGATDFGLVDVHRVELVDVLSALSAVTYPGVLYRVGSDLYFNDAAGNQVRLITGGALDTASVGGITGSGYGSGGIEVNWDGTNYRFRDGVGADDFTALECDDVLLRDGSSHKIRLGAQNMSADYTMLLPAAPPVVPTLLVQTAGGTIAHTVGPDVLTLAGFLSPSDIGSSQNNSAPSGIETATFLRLTATSVINITGLNATQTAGRIMVLMNIGSNTIILTNEDGSSTDINRFAFKGAANINLDDGGAIMLFYDGVSQRWRATLPV